MIDVNLIMAIGGPILGAMATAIAFLFKRYEHVSKRLTECEHARGHAEGRIDSIEHRVDVLQNGKV